MAFKGGTSLSKVFQAIDRFSEDVDLTIGFPEVNETLPTSQNKCKQLGEQLKARVTEHLSSVALPLLSGRLATEFSGGDVTMADEETIVVDYPSCFQKNSRYVEERVKVEFGGRNSIEPHASHTLTAFVAELGYDLVTPEAVETVLAPGTNLLGEGHARARRVRPSGLATRCPLTRAPLVRPLSAG